MANSIEIWRSVSGISEEDFTLLTSQADSGSFSYLDSGTVPEQIYLYKARRYDPDLSAYSDFSPIIYLRGPWPKGVTEMPINTNLGVQSKLGAGVEAVEGQPVQVGRLIDRVSGNLESEMGILDRRSLRYITAPYDAVPGLMNVRGSIVVEPTPEGISEFLCSFLGAPVTTAPAAAPATPTLTAATTTGTIPRSKPLFFVVTTITTAGESLASAEATVTTGGGTDTNKVTVTSPAGGGGITGYNVYASYASGQTRLQAGMPVTIGTDFVLSAPPTQVGALVPSALTYNSHVYSDGFSQLPITIAERRGSSIFCFSGCKTGSVSVRLDKSQNDPFQMTFDMQALAGFLGYLESDLGLNTAGFDTLPAFAAVSAAASISGSVSTDVRSLDLRLNKNMGDRSALDGTRGPNAHYVQGSEPSGTMTLYFSSEAELKRYFGQAQNVANPYGVTKTINYTPIAIHILGGPNPSGIVNQIMFLFTKCAYEAVGQPIQGKEAIMQEIRFKAYHDPATNTSFQIVVWNSQSNASIITPGTALTFVPVNAATTFATP